MFSPVPRRLSAVNAFLFGSMFPFSYRARYVRRALS